MIAKSLRRNAFEREWWCQQYDHEQFHIRGSDIRVLHMCPRMPPKDAFGMRLGLADWRKQ